MTTSNEGSGSSIGINIAAEYQGTVNAEVGGKVTVSSNGEAYGIMDSSDGGSSEVDVTGGVTVKGGTETLGISTNGSGSSKITVGDGITVASTKKQSVAIDAHDIVGTVEISVTGDVTSDNIGIGVMSNGSGYVEEAPAEDTSGEADAGKTVPVDIVIDGTLKAGSAPVLVSEDITPDDLKLTVWKVELNKDDHIVEVKEPAPIVQTASFKPGKLPVLMNTAGALTAGADGLDNGSEEGDGEPAEEKTRADITRDALEKSIQYIIKVDQPEGATLTATGKDGALAKSHDFDVAMEGETVYLKVDIQKGYKLTGAYNGKSKKVALLMDDSGNYYVAVPKGGGVYLTAELEKLPEEKQEEPKKEEPKKEEPKKEETKKSTSTGSRSSSDSHTRMGYWRQDAKGWYFQFLGGGYAKNVVINIDAYSSGGYTPGWYGFGEDGYMKTGWALINGNWYYFDQNGLMRTGWFNINGKDYYFNPGVVSTGGMSLPVGALYVNTTTPDGQRVDENGAKI